MSDYSGFVKNFNLINCYVDTSYFDGSSVVISKFSNEEQQTNPVLKDFVIVANTGFKLKNEFYFKLNPNYSILRDETEISNFENTGWVEITQNNFQPITDALNLYLDLDYSDFQLKGVNLGESLVYEMDSNNNHFYLFLLGGFNEYKLIFRLFKRINDTSYHTYGNVGLQEIAFSIDVEESFSFVGYLSRLNNLTFTANGGKIEPIINNPFFNTYYVDTDKLKEIKQQNGIKDELIMNTYSYPIKFNDDQLIEGTIKTAYISTEIIAKTFKNNFTSLDIFKFSVPVILNVIDCYVKIPFNDDINLSYEDVKGETVNGTITYEVLTNTTTLFITVNEKILYKNIISFGVVTPYKTSSKLTDYPNYQQNRMGYEEPKLYIRCFKESMKGNYLKGFIEPPKTILKNELELLNNLLNDGVYINDENN